MTVQAGAQRPERGQTAFWDTQTLMIRIVMVSNNTTVRMRIVIRSTEHINMGSNKTYNKTSNDNYDKQR